MVPEYEPQEEFHTGWSRRKRVLFGLVSLALVLGLLVSGLEGLLWLWGKWQNGRAVATGTTAPIVSGAPGTLAIEGGIQDYLVTATAVVPSTTPTVLLENDRIAFINQGGEIVTISPDGQNLRTLTDSDKRFQFPAWAPDGQYVAAIGSSREGSGIYLVRDVAEPGQPDERYFSRTRSPIYLYWSPDSRRLSFIANHADNGLALYLASVEGEAGPRILGTGSPFYWHWFNSGEQIIIHSGGTGENARLALLDVVGERPDEVIAAPGFFQAPAISANGRYWAYAAEQEGGLSWLTVWDRENETVEQRRHAGLIAMGWSPASDQLAVISGRPDANDFFGPLRTLNMQTGEERMITRDTVLGFFWSPDGRYLAYISLAGQSNDVQAQGGTKSVLAKTAVSPVSFTPAQQENGHRFRLHVVDVASGEVRLLAQYTPTFIFLSQFLPYFDQYAHSHRVWSPDSRALVLPMRLDGRNQIVVIPVDGSPFLPVANGDMPFWSQQ